MEKIDSWKSAHLVKMEDETGQHIVAFSIYIIVFFLDVKFSEEVEGNDRVNIYYDGQEHDSQQELFAVVSDWL